MGKASEDDHSLQQDVTAFASQLGLGKAENFDYSDFNPDLAKSKLGGNAHIQGASLELSNLWLYLFCNSSLQCIAGTAKSREQKDAKKPRNLPSVQEQDQEQVPEPIAKRPWQGGSGIRPGKIAFHLQPHKPEQPYTLNHL